MFNSIRKLRALISKCQVDPRRKAGQAEAIWVTEALCQIMGSLGPGSDALSFSCLSGGG